MFNAILLLTALVAGHAGEPVPGLSNPRVIPNPAIAGQPVSLRLRWNGCGGYDEQPAVQVSGTLVTVSQTYSQMCGVPASARDVDFPIGSFQPGSYTLTYVSLSDGAPASDPPTNVPFDVTGGSPVFGAPTLGGVGEWLLGLILLLVAWTAVWRQQRSSS